MTTSRTERRPLQGVCTGAERWSDWEETLLREYGGWMTVKQLKATLLPNRTEKGISQRRKGLRVSARRHGGRTLRQWAGEIRVPYYRVFQWAKDGLLPVTRRGRNWWVDDAAITAFMEVYGARGERAPGRVTIPPTCGSHCSVEECSWPVHAHGLCEAHYSRLRKWGDVRMDVPITRMRIKTYLCGVPRCNRRGEKRGWCETHYQRWLATGDVRVNEPIREELSRSRKG